MLSSLDLRARQALGSICRLKLDSSLIPQDDGYVEFSSELMKELRRRIMKVDSAMEEECHDHLSFAAIRVFIHNLLCDPRFEFAGAMGPMCEESHSYLPTAMGGGHVHKLLDKFSCNNDEESDEEPPAIP
ncbi:hypothetical protein D1007_32957 [Hordeum vulgare]|nr:hypothetical protein D1007_32957 [Hordeum vulgare]